MYMILACITGISSMYGYVPHQTETIVFNFLPSVLYRHCEMQQTRITSAESHVSTLFMPLLLSLSHQ